MKYNFSSEDSNTLKELFKVIEPGRSRQQQYFFRKVRLILIVLVLVAISGVLFHWL